MRDFRLAGAALVAGSVLCPAPNARAQSATVNYQTAHLERRLTGLRIDEPVTIDGRLTEPAWERAEHASDFLQVLPDTGRRASERTEVRVLYDDQNLYIGAMCFDSQADHLIVQDLKRDFAIGNNDLVTVFLDTLNDRQSGFLFATNPAGALYDAQATHDGDDLNVNWDGVWVVQTFVSERGWSAEFRIPFKTLRFSSELIAELGLNFGRMLRRLNEESEWSPLPRRYRTLRPSLSGTLVGIEQAPRGRNLKVKPFAIGTAITSPVSGSPDSEFQPDGGLDLKYGVTPSLTADLTVRTDFSQVEVDQQQVNLTRFNLFFPEKREFFIENSGLFTLAGTTGNVAGGGSNVGNVVPFFSRRIGLGTDGRPIPIVGGARLTGRVDRYDVGVIAMRTEETNASPANTFLVGRFARHFAPGTWFGLLVTDRQADGSGGDNLVYGADANVRLVEKFEVSSYLLRSDTPGQSGNDQGRLLRIRWRDDLWAVGGQYERVQANFTPGVGFVARPRSGRYALETSGQIRVRPTFPTIRNFVWRGNVDYFTDDAGRFETRNQTGRFGVDYRNGAISDFQVVRTHDRLYAPFRIRPDVTIPVGDYTYDRYSVVVNSDRSRVLSGNTTIETGTFWSGNSTVVSGGVDFKPGEHFSLGATVSRNDVKLPQAAFVTNLVGVRVNYSFSTRMFLNSFLQYNADTKQFSSNTRFNIIHRPLSDLFVVYNDRRDTVGGQLLERSLVLKLTNLFDF